jgi:hypothetical protein
MQEHHLFYKFSFVTVRMWRRLLQQLNQPCFLNCWKFSVTSGLYPTLSSVYKSACCAAIRRVHYYCAEYFYFNRLCHSSSRNETRFPLSASQDAASDAWRLLSWTMRQPWDTAIQNAGLPRVSLLKFHVKRPCCLVLSSPYCSGNVMKWVLHSCTFHTLCILKYSYVLHAQGTFKSLI